MDADGSNLRRLTDHPASDRSPSFSPDGRHIAFESDRDGNYELYVMDADGNNPAAADPSLGRRFFALLVA